jgi:5-methyltetrahydropteroyltriglutamate--homocysteine methyltransferase
LDRDLANFRRALDRNGLASGFLNAASPGVVSTFQPNQYYPSHVEYLSAVAAGMREEYEAIVAAGFELQIDCPDLAMARHTSFQDLSEAEFLERAEQNVSALNDALRNVPIEAIRIHICWGNYEGPHDRDIELRKVLGIILKVKASAILFEASNPRHEHEWEIWRDADLPDGLILVPGVIASTTNYVEHPRLVAQRLCRFADIVGRDRVVAGTDCGFGTFAGIGKIEPAVAFKKLRTLVEGAEIASKLLWPRGGAGSSERT